MRTRRWRAILLATTIGLGPGAAVPAALGGDEKTLVGSYTLAKRVAADGKVLTSPEIIGFMTFTKTHRTVIMQWSVPDAPAASIALIATYSLSNRKYCESVLFGANGNLGSPGVSYDAPAQTPACTAATSDAAGVAFDVPGERLHLHVVPDGIIATTPRWTDHWEKVK